MKSLFWNIAVVLFVTLATGCNSNDQSKSTSGIDTPESRITPAPSTTEVIAALPDTIFANGKDTTIVLVNGVAFIKGHSRANQRHPTYSVKVEKGQTIIATIKPLEKGGNVRINQLQLPDKSFDGPFGDSLHYYIKKSGTLRFIIGQNTMAGDPWTGDFIFHLRVE
jgi:hypothetical protein